MTAHKKMIFTIGHSTRTTEEFDRILKKYEIKVLADVRVIPASQKFPQFNKSFLENHLASRDVEYIHFPELGGRRKPSSYSINSGWIHPSFRGYADYMESTDFKNGIGKLDKISDERTTAYMCAELLWWKCHRSLISDYFKLQGCEVVHLFNENKSSVHSYTGPAIIENGKLTYPGNILPLG